MKWTDAVLMLLLGATAYALLSTHKIQESELSCPPAPQCPDMWAQMQQEFLANREYIPGKYNCINYSNDWAQIRNLMGYETHTISNGSHRYNLYAYEPQTGNFNKKG